MCTTLVLVFADFWISAVTDERVLMTKNGAFVLPLPFQLLATEFSLVEVEDPLAHLKAFRFYSEVIIPLIPFSTSF